MRNVSSGFKNNVKLLGRELDVKLTKDGTTLDRNLINRVSYSYDGQILKSIMKKLELDLAPTSLYSEGDEINLQIGVKVSGSYEYIDYGNFIVYSREYSKDTKSNKLVCYDKMLYSMKEYSKDVLDFSNFDDFPMSVKDYIENVCDLVGLNPPVDSTFANYDRVLENDPFLDIEGKSLGYTVRDILDDFAEITGSIICVEDDTLIIRYSTKTNDSINDSYLKDTKVDFGKTFGPIMHLVVSRSASSDKIYKDGPYMIPAVDTGMELTIEIVDNQFMNGNDRVDYVDDISNRLAGWFDITETGGTGYEYRVYLNYCDYSSTGILYYEIGDIYNVSGNYCIMLNDEIIIEQGLEENIYSDAPEQVEEDYSKMDTTDRRINQAYLMVDKQQGQIEGYVSHYDKEIKRIETDAGTALSTATTVQSTLVTLTESGGRLETIEKKIYDNSQTFNNLVVEITVNGISVSTDNSPVSTLITNEKFAVTSGDTILAFFGFDSEEQTTKSYVEHLTVNTYFIAGHHRVEKINIDGEDRTGWFYIG